MIITPCLSNRNKHLSFLLLKVAMHTRSQVSVHVFKRKPRNHLISYAIWSLSQGTTYKPNIMQEVIDRVASSFMDLTN